MPGARHCREGASCQYNQYFSSNTPRQQAYNPLPHTHVQELRGAIVYFDHGAEVRKVSPLDSWAALRIDNFSKDDTCSEVLNYLNSIDSDPNEGEAWIITMLSPNAFDKRSAEVVVENSVYATRIIDRSATSYQLKMAHKFDTVAKIMSRQVLAKTLNGPTSTHRHIQCVSEVGQCVVCFDEATLPIRTECGMFYCRDCWVQTCEQESNTKGFIACYGDNCNTKLGFADFQDSLDSSELDSILENSLKVYLRQNPKAFIECPGADCGQMYNREAQGAVTCRRQTECKTPRFCTTCEDPHPGVMCEEYASDADGSKAAMEAYMKETNTKRCRHCWEAVQLREACNHITCRCGKHWCFRCTELFATAQECYVHMNNVHGTPYGQVDIAPGERPAAPPAWAPGIPLGVWQPARVREHELIEDLRFEPPPMELGDGMLQDAFGGFAGELGPEWAPLRWEVPPLDFGEPLVQPRPAPRPVRELQEQARLAATRATMQGHLNQARAEVNRAELQLHARGDAFTRQALVLARNLFREANRFVLRVQQAPTLQQAEAELAGYLRQRDLIRADGDDARQRLEVFHANREAQEQREAEAQQGMDVDDVLEGAQGQAFPQAPAGLNMQAPQAPHQPPIPIVDLQNALAEFDRFQEHLLARFGIPIQQGLEDGQHPLLQQEHLVDGAEDEVDENTPPVDEVDEVPFMTRIEEFRRETQEIRDRTLRQLRDLHDRL